MSGEKKSLSGKSLRMKMAMGSAVIILFLLLLLLTNNYYAMNVVRNQVAISTQNMVSLTMAQMDESLDDVEKYLLTMMVGDDDFHIIETAKKADEVTFSEVELQEALGNTLLVNKTIEAFFVFSPSNGHLIDTYKRDSTYAQRECIRKFLREKLGADESFYRAHKDAWFVEQLEEEYYLFRVFWSGRAYLGAWVNVGTLQKPISHIHTGEAGAVLMAAGDGMPITETGFVKENRLDLSGDLQTGYQTGDSGRYYVVGCSSEKGEFSLAAAIRDEQILENLPFWIKLDLLIALGILLAIPGFVVIQKRTIMNPLNTIIGAMRRFGEGDVTIRIDERRMSEEFCVLSGEFNRMADQIKKLKIDVYEEQLNKQRAELKHLQLQINPHFFLNSLNIIYSFTFTGQYDLIQKMSLYLMRYFRYMFKSGANATVLKEELEHVENYLNIQQIRYPDTLQSVIFVPEFLQDIPVPPLLLHTFVENAVKYEVTAEQSLTISISGSLDESGREPMLHLTVWDNGRGFTPRVLEALTKKERIVDREGVEHIGIRNLVRRLDLLYRGEASVHFSNYEGGGACIELFLPVEFRWDGGDNEEETGDNRAYEYHDCGR